MEAQTHRPSSSSSATSPSDYDVFLSFCGKDTYKNFTGHLYCSLRHTGIATYMANEELGEGDEIRPALEKAIAESRISIPIFSIYYAASKWCLNELVQIIESKDTKGQLVLPIFLNVDPSDVRDQNQEEGFGQHFRQYASRFDKVTVDKWKTALRKAGELKGWDLKNIENGLCLQSANLVFSLYLSSKPTNECKLIQIVVEEVWCKLSATTSLYVHEHLVGIKHRVNILLNLLNVESKDVKIVGIWGMGGIGKTTISEVVFNQIHCRFEGSIFLQDVREVSGKKGLSYLQKQLLYGTLKKKFQFTCNVSQGKTFIRERLCAKKVIIVLDDVDSIEQLQALAGQPDWFGLGSKIIITTRNKHLLNVHKVHETYEMKELDFHDSLHLLSYHAFGKDQAPGAFLELAEGVVRIAGGLPLALEVLGSSLCDKRSLSEWRSTLSKLKKNPDRGIREILRVSYDGLDDEEKNIFLDIVCFFIGDDKEHAFDILEGCGFSVEIGLINLIQKSLVKIVVCKGGRNKLRMHDQLRDMGRDIVREECPDEPGKRSRLWLRKEVLNILNKLEGTRNVEGLVLKFKEDEIALNEKQFSTEAFATMSKLRLLQIDNVHLVGDFKKLPSELKWLSWKGCPLDSIPTDFHLEELVVLDLSFSRIKQVWNDLDQNKQFRELKVLNLSGCQHLTRVPDLSRLPNLEKLNLEGCIKLEEHQSNICRSLDWIGNMRNLKSLSPNKTSIIELPDAVGFLEKIEILSLKYCSNLVKLPYSMGKMRLLKEFSISESGIHNLPEDFGMLSNLRKLVIFCCPEFGGFPENFGKLTSLTYLDLSHNNFCSLPADITALSHLRHLFLTNCRHLQYLPDMHSSLRGLMLHNCVSLESLPNLSNLKKLKILSLSNCYKLAEIPSIEELESVLYLWTSGCCSDFVNSVKKRFGQIFLQNFRQLNFPGSEIPDWFTPTKRSYSNYLFNRKRVHEISLDCEVPATRLRNPLQHQGIVGLIICFVLPNRTVRSLVQMQIKRNDRFVNTEIPLSIVVIMAAKSHQYQTLLWYLPDYYFKFVSELKAGDKISFIFKLKQEMEVKGGLHVVYDETKQSTLQRIGNFLTLSSHDDVINGGEPSSSRKRKIQLVDLDDDDDDDDDEDHIG